MSASRDRVGGRTREPHADLFAGGFELRALGCGKQDVPGGDPLDAALAQARGDRLAGFAEADEAKCEACCGGSCVCPSES